MIYEPYMPWSCGRCGREGEIILPNQADIEDRVCLVVNAHRAISPDCTGSFKDGKGLRTGNIIVPSRAGARRRRVPWSKHADPA